MADQAGRFPDLLPATPETRGLDERDAALAHAIYDAVIRRWITLEYLLNTTLKQPLDSAEPSLQAVLLAGAAQLLLLDRIPVHAALNESVELAKRLVRPGAAPLTNAVLRKIAGLRAVSPQPGVTDTLPLADGRSLPLTRDVFPANPVERLAAVTSHPRHLITAWIERFGLDAATALAHHSLVTPPTILNTAFARDPGALTAIPHTEPGHHVSTASRYELLTLLSSRNDLWVQDPASSRAVASVAHLRPNLIADVCAGRGTKTRQLAATFPSARIIASDADPERVRALRATFSGHPRIQIAPLAALPQLAAGKADLVLLDVPCSNTGVLARRPEARYRAGAEQLARLAGIQRQIIAEAAPLLSDSPRGRILYSTCSIEPDENERQVEWAVRWRQFHVEHAATLLPHGAPGDEPTRYHDGSFSALLG